MLSSSVYDVSLAEDVSVLAKTNNNLPLIWGKKFGKGRIIYTNSNFFEGNIVRGLMNQIISYGNDWYINRILNSKLIQIDDFPSPVPQTIMKLSEKVMEWILVIFIIKSGGKIWLPFLKEEILFFLVL